VFSVAKKEDVERLQAGTLVWNAWRRDTKPLIDIGSGDQIGPDLSGANLSGANLDRALLNGGVDLSSADLSDANLGSAYLNGSNLSGANLRSARLTGGNLWGTRLTGADLTNATLRYTDLCEANLFNANLTGADLLKADLSGAHLRGADLSKAYLKSANFTNADLSKANLSGTTLCDTVLSNTNFTNVLGLETCHHMGPSVIDFRTLKNSYPLPLTFLRGVGLPESVIEYLPSLLSQPIQYYSCFISYSSQDDDFAKRIHADLQNKGVRCWFAPHDLPIGGKILDEIDAAIRLRDKVLLILSEHSIGSDWVEDEVKTAYEEERRRKQTMLFPIRLDDAVMETKEAWAAKLRADRNIGDFRQWKDHDRYREVFERVLRDLSAGSKKTG
jgi:uncharacterized protein YjbI with pentapeptide repeats